MLNKRETKDNPKPMTMAGSIDRERPTALTSTVSGSGVYDREQQHHQTTMMESITASNAKDDPLAESTKGVVNTPTTIFDVSVEDEVLVEHILVDGSVTEVATALNPQKDNVVSSNMPSGIQYFIPSWFKNDTTTSRNQDINIGSVKGKANTHNHLIDKEMNGEENKKSWLRGCSDWFHSASSYMVACRDQTMDKIRASVTTLTKWNMPEVHGYVAVFLVLAALCCMYGVVLMTSGSKASPTSDLRDFVLYERANNDNNKVQLLNVEDLETDVFRTYARATCVEGGSVNITRDALWAGLKGIPESVRE